MNNNNCCLANILEVINILQNKTEKIEYIPCSCDRPFLGVSTFDNAFVFNTRPVSFYNCSNELLTFPYELTYNGETLTGNSSVLRVEDVKGCCCTCRVLAPNPDQTAVLPYVSTSTFCTINVGCVTALTCLPDTSVECL